MKFLILTLFFSLSSYANYVEINSSVTKDIDIYVKAENVTTKTLIGDTTTIDWAEVSDASGSYATGVFTAPQDDTYYIIFAIRYSGNLSSLYKRYINNSFDVYFCNIPSTTTHICIDIVKLSKNQTLSYRVLTGATAVDDTSRNFITISNRGF